MGPYPNPFHPVVPYFTGGAWTLPPLRKVEIAYRGTDEFCTSFGLIKHVDTSIINPFKTIPATFAGNWGGGENLKYYEKMT